MVSIAFAATLTLFRGALAQDTCSDSESAASGCSSQGTNYLMVGNPGVGKSTILNGFAGKTLFQSGPKFGKGMTTVLQAETVGKNTYMDTPGLADIELRKQAAREIEAALKKGGEFKIFFVVTLESGRVKPADRTTMQLVLESAPIKEYAVIINKLEPEEVEMILQNVDNAQDHVRIGLMSGLPVQTLYFHFAERMQYLAAKSDQAFKLDEEFRSFIENVQSVTIAGADVSPIKVDEFDALTEQFETMIKNLHADNDYLSKKMLEERRSYHDMINQMKEENRRLGTRLDQTVEGKDVKPLVEAVLPGVMRAVLPGVSDTFGTVARIGKGLSSAMGTEIEGGKEGNPLIDTVLPGVMQTVLPDVPGAFETIGRIGKGFSSATETAGRAGKGE